MNENLPMMQKNKPAQTSIQRIFWTFSGIFFLILGIIGLFLPLMPTVPFVIVAAFCFSKGNERYERWLLNHPHLGPHIRNWRERRAIPKNAKIVATLMMGISCTGVLIFIPLPMSLAPSVVCALVAVWLWRQPHA